MMRFLAALLLLVLVLFFAVTGTQAACTDLENTAINKCKMSSQILFMESLGSTPCQYSLFTEMVCKEYNSMKMCIENGINSQTCMPFEGELATQPLMTGVDCSPNAFEKERWRIKGTPKSGQGSSWDVLVVIHRFCQSLTHASTSSLMNVELKGTKLKALIRKHITDVQRWRQTSQISVKERRSQCLRSHLVKKLVRKPLTKQLAMVGIKCSPKNFEDSCMPKTTGLKTYPGCAENEAVAISKCKMHSKPVFMKSFNETSCDSKFTEEACNEYYAMKACIKSGTSDTCKPLEGEMYNKPIMEGIKCSPQTFEDSCMLKDTYTGCTDEESTTINTCKVHAKPVFVKIFGKMSCISKLTEHTCNEYKSMRDCIKSSTNGTCKPLEGEMATQPIMAGIKCTPENFEVGCMSLTDEAYTGCTRNETAVINSCKIHAKPVFKKEFGEMPCNSNLTDLVCNEYKAMKTCIKSGTSNTCKPLEGDRAIHPIMSGIQCSPNNFEDSCFPKMKVYKGCTENETTFINNCKMNSKPVFKESFGERSCESNLTGKVCMEYESMKACIKRHTSEACKPLEGEMATHPIMTEVDCSPQTFEDTCLPEMVTGMDCTPMIFKDSCKKELEKTEKPKMDPEGDVT
ncbi:hypothetical protein C0Q70_12341 [Pomacea canaliculata]|uniref:Uncharacterized protein n=1 Tax=Pomacea canaliculata TaxID=400727 RepID=A0A2T7P181_POMCA|nr:hypothetical protein C0Q70_12341 [Pomacea canaliculata]